MQGEREGRAGEYVKGDDGIVRFIPRPLPPVPGIVYNEETLGLLSEADRALARLDGVGSVLPNVDHFVSMFIKKEALLSAQIEGTQASLEGVLEFESHILPRDDINEVAEVIDHIDALEYGVEEGRERELDLEFMLELHELLIGSSRGNLHPGELRHVQNWIGGPGCTMDDAIHVPPHPRDVPMCMEGLLGFMMSDTDHPPLIRMALVHAQFETIHPFMDGNGRLGRLLMTILLSRWGVMERPLLILSSYLKAHRGRYYEHLTRIRTHGRWEDWIRFILWGVIEMANEGVELASRINALRMSLMDRLFQEEVQGHLSYKLVDILFEIPIIGVPDIVATLDASRAGATKTIRRFVDLGLLREITGKDRYRKYIFSDYIDILKRGMTP